MTAPPWTPEMEREVVEACERATPGPLHAAPRWPMTIAAVVETDEGEQVADCYDNRLASDARCAADARFFALARTALPAALAEIQNLRMQLAAADEGLLKGRDPSKSWQGRDAEIAGWMRRAEEAEGEIASLRASIADFGDCYHDAAKDAARLETERDEALAEIARLRAALEAVGCKDIIRGVRRSPRCMNLEGLSRGQWCPVCRALAPAQQADTDKETP